MSDPTQAADGAQEAGSEPAVSRTRARIREVLAGHEHAELEPADGTVTIEVDRGVLVAVLTELRDRAGFETATFVTAVDRSPDAPRFEVSHQLLSIAHNDRVRVVTRVDEDDPVVPSCTHLWPGAAYMERECFDMFGVRFDGHEGLKRLLMPEEYDHFPLRKDFPHQGIEPDRLYREWDRARTRPGSQDEAPTPR